MAHKLKIEIEDILQDPNYIKVIDWSSYDGLLPVTNRVTKVNVPGEEDFRLIELPQNDNFIYSSRSLKLSKSIDALPDGLWVFTYSVCPNERVFTIENHFRTVQLENKIMGFIAKLNDGYKEEMFKALYTCLLNIKALKTSCIDSFNTQKAYDLYADTERMFTNLLNKL